MELEVRHCVCYNNPNVLSEMPCHFSDLIMCSPVCDDSHWVGSTDFHSVLTIIHNLIAVLHQSCITDSIQPLCAMFSPKR